MHSRIGRTRFTAAELPPIMIDSVALIAPISPPLTGASSRLLPFADTFAASACVATGEMLLISMTTEPVARASRTPFVPAITASTSGVSATIVMTTEACLATSAGELAPTAPALTSSSSAARLLLKTTTW